MQDIHDHEEVTPEPRELRAHDEVARPYAPQQRAQLAFVVRRRAADGLLDPAVDAQALATAEVVNLETLVADRLTVTANPDVSVNHNAPKENRSGGLSVYAGRITATKKDALNTCI